MSTIPIEAWLKDIRRHLHEIVPEFDHVVDNYVGEAQFGASVIEAEVARLAPGSHILEVGAGALFLSCALRASGFHVVAIEPAGAGFGHMDRLRQVVFDYAVSRGCEPELLTIPAEEIDITAGFDYAFSINVMEHVNDVSAVLHRVFCALRPGAAYRFVCPNYAFPYEPHFDMPTLFSKELTGRVFRARILASRIVVDPEGTWRSLNWISVGSVRRICRDELGALPEFDRLVFYRFLRRAVDDPIFQRRHSPLMKSVFSLFDRMGVTTLLKWLPVATQPAMSCRLVRVL